MTATIFGLTEKRPHWLLLNHIIIAGKLVIYNSRLKNILPSLRYLMIKLDHIESIERSIAIKNNRLKTHEGKWKPLINLRHISAYLLLYAYCIDISLQTLLYFVNSIYIFIYFPFGC